MATSSQRMIARIRNELGLALSAQARIERTHAGHIQRSQGAFSWYVVDPGNHILSMNVGGYDAVTTLLKSKRLQALPDSMKNIVVEEYDQRDHL